MSKIKLSYVITTFNKLPYLKEVMRVLLQNVRPDEEIVVADGGSTDGTKEYLQQLYDEGQIHQFVSERDNGEAHGLNKTILMSKGDLIKLLSDDDVYYYPGISACRTFMEQNELIDALVGNSGTASSLQFEPPFLNPEMQHEFEKYVDGINETFYCNGLSLMLRRSSIPFLGLFNTQFVAVDLEYTIRTGRIANYAFATQFLVTRIVNPSSNGSRFADRCRKEQLQLCSMYNYPVPATWDKPKVKKRSAWWNFKNYINTRVKSYGRSMAPAAGEILFNDPVPVTDINTIYSYHGSILKEINEQLRPVFLTKL